MSAAGLYELELLKPLHLDTVFGLSSRSDPHAWTRPLWQSSLEHDWVLGAWIGDELLAALALRQGYLETELLYLLVAPEKRRQGLASLLLDQALERTRALQGERMLLEVRASNQAAIDLYQSRGFVQEGRRRGYYPLYQPDGRTVQGYEDALLMSKII